VVAAAIRDQMIVATHLHVGATFGELIADAREWVCFRNGDVGVKLNNKVFDKNI